MWVLRIEPRSLLEQQVLLTTKAISSAPPRQCLSADTQLCLVSIAGEINFPPIELFLLDACIRKTIDHKYIHLRPLMVSSFIFFAARLGFSRKGFNIDVSKTSWERERHKCTFLEWVWTQEAAFCVHYIFIDRNMIVLSILIIARCNNFLTILSQEITRT